MITYSLLALDIYRVLIRFGDPGGPLITLPYFIIPDCLVCETDVDVDTFPTFSSTSADYQLLVSDSQLVGDDYFSWVSTCSGK